MKIQRDLREFIALMNSHEAEYVIVGGHAVAYHGYPRFTGDIDFFVKPSTENARRILAVLQAFGFSEVAGLQSTLLEAGKVIQLGRPPNRIDLLTALSGVTFEEVVEGSVETQLDRLPVRMIGFNQLVKNKTASNRPKDALDVHELNKRKT